MSPDQLHVANTTSVRLPTLPAPAHIYPSSEQGQKKQVAKRRDRRVRWFCAIEQPDLTKASAMRGYWHAVLYCPDDFTRFGRPCFSEDSYNGPETNKAFIKCCTAQD